MTFRRPSFHGQWALLAAVIALGGLTPVFAQDAGEKAPVPDAAAQAEALKIIAEIFEEQWSGAKTSAQKTALAEKMVEQAAKTGNDPTGQFVLLRVARDVATQAGDVTTAFAAIEMLDRGFVVDAVKMKTDALFTAANSIVRTEHAKAAASESIALVRAAMAQDDYPVAEQLLRVGQAAARKSRDGELIRGLTDLGREMARIVKAYDALQPALKVLDEKPTDPAANLAVGKFYCLVKGDWATGVDMLALGNDSPYQAPAQKELEEISSPEEQVALGDAWWELGQTSEEREKELLLARACYWYRQAEPQLPPGLLKRKVCMRLEKLLEVVVGPSSSARADSTWTFSGVFSCLADLEAPPARHPAIPSELEATFRSGQGRVWGIGRIGTTKIDGRLHGWFGKALVWSVPKPAVLDAEFRLQSKHLSPNPNRGPTAKLAIFTTEGRRLGHLSERLTRKDVTFNLAYDRQTNTLTVESLGTTSKASIVVPDDSALQVVLVIVVRYPGQMCDTAIALTRQEAE